jgi:hypothetical protein
MGTPTNETEKLLSKQLPSEIPTRIHLPVPFKQWNEAWCMFYVSWAMSWWSDLWKIESNIIARSILILWWFQLLWFMHPVHGGWFCWLSYWLLFQRPIQNLGKWEWGGGAWAFHIKNSRSISMMFSKFENFMSISKTMQEFAPVWILILMHVSHIW